MSGAFLNPADRVATLYKEEIEKVASSFDAIVFAVFYPGYGKNNFTPFAKAFEDADPSKKVNP